MLSEYNLLKEVNILKFRSRTIWTKIAEQNSEEKNKDKCLKNFFLKIARRVQPSQRCHHSQM